MRFQPKGLWVIGANGRVDLITKAAAPILVDQSEPLSRPVTGNSMIQAIAVVRFPLTQESFRDLVRAGL